MVLDSPIQVSLPVLVNVPVPVRLTSVRVDRMLSPGRLALSVISWRVRSAR